MRYSPKRLLFQMCLFPLCGIWRLSDRSSLALTFPSLCFSHPHFLSQAFLSLLSMHLFVSGSFSHLGELSPSLFLPLSFKVYTMITRLTFIIHFKLLHYCIINIGRNMSFCRWYRNVNTKECTGGHMMSYDQLVDNLP